MKHIGLLSALGVAGAVLSMSTASLAAPPPPRAPAPVPTVAGPRTTERMVSYTGPNVPLITGGLGIFGLSYVPALVVGAASGQSADRNLYIPVAGPWLDLANRPMCGGRGTNCATEPTNKMLLGVDGVFQGVGAAMTVVGLLVPTRRTVMTKTTAEKDGPTIRIAPARLGTGYGVSAVGTW
jgi:hypothetical protein